MAKNRNLSIILVSALIGAIFAAIVCFGFFMFIAIPDSQDEKPSKQPIAPPTATPVEIPKPDIRADDVKSVSINTVYKGYFQSGDRCSKSYNEYFGDGDGFANPNSPCAVTIKFNRDGSATRSIAIGRWDKKVKEKRVVEKIDSAAKITTDQFDKIASLIVANDAFRSWNDGIMINVSNTTVSVEYSGGTRSPMSNVDEKTIAFLPMVEAFKELEKQINWKPV
jgi:hypothetical protein